MTLIYNATFDKNTRKLSFEDRAGNEIYSFTVPERAPAVDDITKPLTFRATQDGSTVTLIKKGSPSGSFQTSRDGGNTWTDYTIGTDIALNAGDEVSFRAKADRTSQSTSNYFYFNMTGKIEAWHNVMSLYRTNDFATYKSVVGYAFVYLFKSCTSLTKAPGLPATTLAIGCYWSMFSGCTSLTEVPELPVTALAEACYYYMFQGCTSLTKAPALPATTLDKLCYGGMFSGCTSLTKAPVLPATTLAPSCYRDMFKGCTSLVNAPALPATTLTDSCYYYMFQGCTSLTEAPALPATTLADYCYGSMFSGCTSLTEAPALPATTLAEYCYGSMFSGCTSLTKAPVLPATTLAIHCCLNMFQGCTSLTEAPALPATTLAGNCYESMFNDCTSLTKAHALSATTLAVQCCLNMFKGCTSLTEAPKLPAITLAEDCYSNMFDGCTSLTKSPELPATTLANYCYWEMFKGCSRLNEVRCKMPSSYSSSQISSTYAKNWLSGVSSTGTFYTNADANWPSGANGIPTSWTRVNEREKDDLSKPLTFKATQDGSTVSLTKNGSPTGDFQTSTDGGNTWVDYTLNNAITLNTGDEVSFRAKDNRTSEQSNSHYFIFEMTGKIEAWHNVMSLYRTNDFATYNTASKNAFYRLFYTAISLTKAPALPATTLAQYCYSYMFYGCTSLTEAPELPATTLSNYCYNGMFYGCTSLTEAPELPATTLSNYCYSNMFKGCTSLVNAPALPATALTSTCYNGMFSGCTSLTEAPELPATALTSTCYSSMFNGCTSLVNAPALPATALTDYCYMEMFYGCTSLVNAPALPATTLADFCYSSMFYGCTSLTKAPVLPATTLADYCYDSMFNGCSSLNEVRCQMPSSYSSSTISSTYASNWLSGVSSTGTFYTNYDANWPSGASGIPEGWTRVNEGAPTVDDITKPLTFRATQDGSTVKLSSYNTVNGAFQTSLDGGNTWVDYTLESAITLNTGDEVSFRAKADRTSQEYSGVYFKMTGKIEAWHNVMSLLRTSDFATYESVVRHIFLNLFQGCTSLTKAPVLPATTLAEDCYSNMFDGCTSLTEAPALPATTLDRFCYWEMFKGCTSLTKSPELSVTTFGERCCKGMFEGCSSLNEVRCKIPSSYTSSQISSFASNWLSGVSSTGTFYTNADANWPSGASGIPTGWTRVPEIAPAVDGIRKPLTFRSTQDGSTVKLTRNGSPDGSFQTSRDGGNTWTDYTLGTYITLNTGREVSFRAKADRTTDQTVQNYFSFEMTGKIEAWHNVMSLYRTNDFATYSYMVSHAFYKLFLNCTSLTKAPKLPVTTLAHSCYYSMFDGCTSLTKAPALPSTTLAVQCYYSMFYGCTSLTEAPALPATTLAGSCYQYMFYGCTSLTKTPALSVTTLAGHCYQEMFRNCSNLNEVRCKMSSSYSSNAISTYAPYWLSGVSSKGTFYTNADANWPSGDDGIPQTWTRANIDDYPTT